MFIHKYKSSFTNAQIADQIKELHRLMFWLLRYQDPDTRNEYPNVDFDKFITNILYRLAGLNELIGYPSELVTVMSLVESARLESTKQSFSYQVYRKLVLDAHSELDKVGEKKQ